MAESTETRIEEALTRAAKTDMLSKPEEGGPAEALRPKGDLLDKHRPIQDFSHPTALPDDPEQRRQWQDQNRTWWEDHPMRYDWKEKVGEESFSRAYFEEIDRRFFSAAREFMPWQEKPFDALLDFSALAGQDVLEIGVGSGSHARLLAESARSFTGIDLTEFAVHSTQERMKQFGLSAVIRRMDAERMEFATGSFDLVWSWGVIHHSANTRAILEEIHRVLRPGGRAVIMVYHRSFWLYWVMGALVRGLLGGGFLHTRSVHRIVQQATDGALARYYTPAEWRGQVADLFTVEDIRIYGAKAELVPLPAGRLKTAVLRWIPDRVGRFLTNRLGWGAFLVSKLRKPA